jgi:hypothetical protein
MPFTKDGIKPDIIFNPHSLPSRMTMGVLFEGMAAKISAVEGTIKDGTIFKKINIDDIADDLQKLGYNRNGTERLYNGITGKYIDVEIFIGPIYYQRLQKFTVDTVYSHKTCPTDAITHQPLDGKSARGGLRLGLIHTFRPKKVTKSVHLVKSEILSINIRFKSCINSSDEARLENCGKLLKLQLLLILEKSFIRTRVMTSGIVKTLKMLQWTIRSHASKFDINSNMMKVQRLLGSVGLI